MEWADKLNFHTENLVPGVALALALIGTGIMPLAWLDRGVAIEVGLLGAAYLLGVIANVLGRLLLDPASEKVSRKWVFRVFCGEKLEGIKNSTHAHINAAYNRYVSKGMADPKTSSEVAKRRQTARLLRSTLCPGAVFLVILFRIKFQWPAYQVGLAVLAGYIALLFLYSYSEAIILHEAFHAVVEGERKVLSEEGANRQA